MNAKIKEKINSLVLNFLALLLIIFIVGPLIWVAVASIQGESELLRKPQRIFPENPTLENYNYVFTGKIPTAFEVKGQLLRSRISQEARLIPAALKNSFIVATAVMGINLIFGTLGAYTFSRLRFRGKVVTFNFFLGSRLIPVIAVAIPYYVIIQTAAGSRLLSGSCCPWLFPDWSRQPLLPS
jgi:multiple sugar transport system permease protein